MSRLYLVRHAKPAASWGQDPDPGLDAHGAAQALATATQLARSLARISVYTSALRRCRETAEPLCRLWGCEATLFPPVAEIPAPPLETGAKRDWLARATAGTWRELCETAPAGSIDYAQWRRKVVEALTGIERDCVIYTHFIAINIAVGAAQTRDEVVCFRPDHASVTAIEAAAGRVQLIELGRQAQTSVLTGRQ